MARRPQHDAHVKAYWANLCQRIAGRWSPRCDAWPWPQMMAPGCRWVRSPGGLSGQTGHHVTVRLVAVEEHYRTSTVQWRRVVFDNHTYMAAPRPLDQRPVPPGYPRDW